MTSFCQFPLKLKSGLIPGSRSCFLYTADAADRASTLAQRRAPLLTHDGGGLEAAWRAPRAEFCGVDPPSSAMIGQDCVCFRCFPAATERSVDVRSGPEPA